MVPFLINKDVFQPSYNNLKFRAWNHILLLHQQLSIQIMGWRTGMNEVGGGWGRQDNGEMEVMEAKHWYGE